jgi:hypothetical protein
VNVGALGGALALAHEIFKEPPVLDAIALRGCASEDADDERRNPSYP